MSNDHVHYTRLAIEQARKSLEAGLFPAGAVIVEKSQILAMTISDSIVMHAESQAIDTLEAKYDKQFNNAILYASMQPCLMCLSRAYWAGIRTVYYALAKKNTNSDYYESTLDPDALLTKFNAKMEVVQIPELEAEALAVVHEWEKQQTII